MSEPRKLSEIIHEIQGDINKWYDAPNLFLLALELEAQIAQLQKNQIPDKPYGGGTHFSESLKYACDWEGRDITGEVIEEHILVKQLESRLRAAQKLLDEYWIALPFNYREAAKMALDCSESCTKTDVKGDIKNEKT